MTGIINQLTQEFQLKPFQVQNTVDLIDQDNTIPFIARYRKEVTGALDDQVLRQLHERLLYLRNLEARKEDVRRLIDEQGKLTDVLNHSIDCAKTLQEIEDIYRPYKQKRKTRASIAKSRGLEPLALILLAQDDNCDALVSGIMAVAKSFMDASEEIESPEMALAGAMDIIAEMISDDAAHRKYIRDFTQKTGSLVTKVTREKEHEENSVYKMYHDFREPLTRMASHRVLAVNRGEREGFLKVTLDCAEEPIFEYLFSRTIPKKRSVTSQYVEEAIRDSYSRLIYPSIENELRKQLTERASAQAMKVFSVNLKNLLMQPPIPGKAVLGLDPAYRTGCKLAVVDGTGKLLETGVVYPTPPQSKVEEAKRAVRSLIEKYRVELIAIGNGTASKETEIFTAELLKELNRDTKHRLVSYMVVSEAGASVYSASKLAAEEFPEFDVSLRSAVSIARRLQDPLAELVKIDPKAVGVGQYQHDMDQKRLTEALSGVVEDCVNGVGVNLNMASMSLLSYVSGINGTVAKNIYEYRLEHGAFSSRTELKKVKKLGDKTFEQCAGFLRIPDSKNVLDNTQVHPESYQAAKSLLKLVEYTEEDVRTGRIPELRKRAESIGLDNLAERVGVGVPTLSDILAEMQKPGRDPRDELPKPMLQTDVMDIKDVKPGMTFRGTVRNVADFGAFVDIGVHQDGLVHISQMGKKFIKHPMDVVAVGDIVDVWVLDVDSARKRISLTMKPTEGDQGIRQ